MRIRLSLSSSGNSQSSIRNPKFLVFFCALLIALCFTAEAQQPKKVPRIVFLSARGEPTPSTPDPNGQAFRQGLQDLGYIEGKNILVEYRYTGGMTDRVPKLVDELVRLKVDVLVTTTTVAISSAK